MLNWIAQTQLNFIVACQAEYSLKSIKVTEIDMLLLSLDFISQKYEIRWKKQDSFEILRITCYNPAAEFTQAAAAAAVLYPRWDHKESKDIHKGESKADNYQTKQ